MRVRDFMSIDPLVVDPGISVAEALDKMSERDIWSPVVLKDGNVLGFLTERDILSGIITTGVYPGTVKVGDVMSKRYGALKAEETLAEAARAMIKAKARLVVLKDGELKGIVTAADMVRGYAESTSIGPLLRPYATWKVAKVHSQASVREAARIMKAERIGSLLVEESGKFIGIFTERDAVKRYLLGGGDPFDPVGDYSTKELITLDADATLADAARLMTENKIKRIPLKEEGEIRGIITARDVVEAIWRITSGEELAP